MEVSVHPPNMMDNKGELLPSSFIPFCAYQSNVLGSLLPDLPFTSCSLAYHTVLDGQLCYYFNVSSMATKVTQEGRTNGLMILLDFAPPTISEVKTESETKWGRESAIIGMSENNKNSVRLFVQTLSRFSSFAISCLQKMIGTKSFLGLPDDIKKCQDEALEECHLKQFFKDVTEDCGCVPWGLDKLRKLDSEVSHHVIQD